MGATCRLKGVTRPQRFLPSCYKTQLQQSQSQCPHRIDPEPLTMWTFMLTSVLLAAGLRADDYDNSPRGILRHSCSSQQAVSQINSSYSHTNQDRQWKMECKALSSSSSCSWSEIQHLEDRELAFSCPALHVVSGLYSVYNAVHGGRSWKFLCCTAPNLMLLECRQTPMVNYWEEDFLWKVPEGHFLSGLQTHHRSSGDRRWAFTYCKGTTEVASTINSKIMASNKQLPSGLLLEGDVLVPNGRNARVCDNCRWPKLSVTVDVAFVVSDAFSSSERSLIDAAIGDFTINTCIRFVARSGQTDYISIVKQDGCWSSVGRLGGLQEISLGAGCLEHGIIQHELIHALGFWHEQSRTDRDLYVQINYNNIQSEYHANFEKRDTNNLNVPYDYSSVMHYASDEFSKNSGATIVPTDTSAVIGQRYGMSANDVLKINKFYVCKDYLHKYQQWDNLITETLSRRCPPGQAVSGIESVYDSAKKDRLWSVSCKAFKQSRTCRWSDFVNGYWSPIDYSCGHNEVIAGVYSEYSTIFNDRKWKFYCCSAAGVSTSSCQTQTNINFYQEQFSWTAPSDHFLSRVQSTIDYTTRDRRWTVTYCQGTGQVQV